MKISVIGTGYVGLVTGAVFADWGHTVICADIDKKKIALLEKAVMPIYEEGLKELVVKNVKENRLSFTTNVSASIKRADVVFIAVGTPSNQSGSADLSAVWAVAKTISENLSGYKIIVTKSTVPVSTNEKIKQILVDKGHLDKFDVVSNPEFLREGTAIFDANNVDRVVLGSDSKEAVSKIASLYTHLNVPFIKSDFRSAELIKYASNAFLATKISFINEIARICDKANADVKTVADGMGYDKRIGRAFLNAGLGYGGSCFKPGTLVYVKNSPDLKCKVIEDVVQPKNEMKRVGILGFNLLGRKSLISNTSALTRRLYKGKMVNIKTRMGRYLEVTADHTIISFHNGEFITKLANDIKVGDLIPVTGKLPSLDCPEELDVIDIISKDKYLRSKVLLIPRQENNTFLNIYNEIKPYVEKFLKHPYEIKRYNRLPLRVYLSFPGNLRGKINLYEMGLYTVASTVVPARIAVNSNLMRYLGYYLAEGHIHKDTGRKDSVRERIGITFNENESEYLSDVVNFYTANGIKHTVRFDKKNHNVSVIVSSKVWSYLLDQCLGLGSNSYNKRFPTFVYGLSDNLKLEILRGLFSGDGSLSIAYKKYPYIEFATVSKELANDCVLLLQSLGVVPSINERHMNKATVPAFIIRISGRIQLEKIISILGEEKRRKMQGYFKNVKYINSLGYKSLENYNLVPVTKVSTYLYEGEVYSAESLSSTLVVNSGIIVHNCFPKDVEALYRTSSDQEYDFRLLRGVMDVNERQKYFFVEKIVGYFGNLSGKTLACLGTAFKNNTDDVRKSVAIEVIKILRGEGAKIRVFDPAALENAKKVLGNDVIYYAKDIYDAIEGADGICILTEWQEFAFLDFDKVKKVSSVRVIFDGRNILDSQKVTDAGLEYVGIGRRII